MELDLGYQGNLDPEIAVLFNKIANKLRGPFTEIVSEISDPMKGNIDWWVEGPASRNTITSPFFHYYCAFNLVHELIKKDYNISKIIVDSFALEKILKQYFRINGKSIPIKYKGIRFKSYIKQLIIPFIIISRELYSCIYQYRFAQKTKHLQKLIPNKDLTLIDMYVLPGFISKDRYYNGLWEYLSSDKKRLTFFVPTLVMIPKSEILEAYKKLRGSNRNFLIKEDYLKIRDILFAIGHCFRIMRIRVKPIHILGIDIAPLIREDINSMKGLDNAVIALLNYRFVRRLKERSVRLRLVIDWFENQVVDRGWNAGFNLFYPDVKTIGYSGQIPSPNYLCSFPSECENINGLLPSEIAVVGKSLVAATKEFVSDLNVKTAPSFRFKHIWKQDTTRPNPRYCTVLVTLSQIPEHTMGVLKTVNEAIDAISSNSLRFWIKPHPSVSEDSLRKWWDSKWPEAFIIIQGDASYYLPRSDILISGMSSICVEAMAVGIPVIEIENTSGISYSTIPKEIPEDLWRSCKTSQQVFETIQYYKNRNEEKINEHQELSYQIKKNYFEPVTKESVYKFLELEI